MAQPTNLFDRYDANGVREDLIDKIFNTDPEETPVVSAIGRAKAMNTYHEWQRDSLASPNKDNAAIDGNDYSADAITATERVGNYCQIFTKAPSVSRRVNIVKKAGRGAEAAYLKAKAMMEIKRDIEAMVCSNNAAVAGNSSTASKSAGFGVQCYVNTSHGGSGATASWTSGAPTTAITAGTNRAFTETLLKTVVQATYTASGSVPRMVVLPPAQKAVFSTFTGIATSRYQVSKKEQARIIGGADVYMSDFGELEIVPNYVMATSAANDAFLVNPDYADLCFLDTFRTEEMGKAGDHERWLITADVCLALRNSKAHAKVANLT